MKSFTQIAMPTLHNMHSDLAKLIAHSEKIDPANRALTGGSPSASIAPLRLNKPPESPAPTSELDAALLRLLDHGNVRLEAKFNAGPNGPVTICAWGMDRRTGACTWHTVANTIPGAIALALQKLRI